MLKKDNSFYTNMYCRRFCFKQSLFFILVMIDLENCTILICASIWRKEGFSRFCACVGVRETEREKDRERG